MSCTEPGSTCRPSTSGLGAASRTGRYARLILRMPMDVVGIHTRQAADWRRNDREVLSLWVMTTVSSFLTASGRILMAAHPRSVASAQPVPLPASPAACLGLTGHLPAGAPGEGDRERARSCW
jgi:hypothetical protein